MLPEWVARIRALFGRRRHEAELDEELRYHLDREAERNRDRGMSGAAARAAAARAFGSVTEIQDQVRAGWGWRRLGELRQDARFALRSFRREPTLVLTVVVAIGLGVGLNTAYFTLFNAYFFKPFAVTDPQSLYQIRWDSRDRRGHDFSWRQYRELGRLDVVAESFGVRPILARIEREPVRGVLVTGNYFRVLGVGPALGRVLTPADVDSARASQVVILSYSGWQARFGKDPRVIGRSMLIRGQPLEIVGVARAGFGGVEEVEPEFWAPITLAPKLDPSVNPVATDRDEVMSIVARLKPGASAETTRDSVERWLRQTTADRLDAGRVVGVELKSRATAQQLSPAVFRTLAPILAAFALVLVAACANVASAMVARGGARQRELAIRLSLGAGRGRLVRQLVTECLLLAIPAAVAGLFVSRLTLAAAARFMAVTMPESFQARVPPLAPLAADYRVLMFTLVVALLCAILFGLVPAFQSTRPEIVRVARGDFGIGPRSSRLRQGLVIGQIIVATLLLVTAGILLRGTSETQHRELGFETRGVVALDLDERFRATGLERLQLTASLRSIAATTQVPLEGSLRPIEVTVEGSRISAASLAVSAQFFEALSIGLAAGRPFLEDEGRAHAPVAIVSETLARTLWHGANPLDHSIVLAEASTATGSPLAQAGRPIRIVGVARDVVSGWIGNALHRPVVYFPLALGSPGARLVVRGASGADETRQAVERSLATLDPSVIEEMHTLDETVAFSIWPMRAAYWFAVLVGGVALLLTLTGVYGVLAFVVARRTREIGIRAALGASRATVVSLIAAESGRLAGIGIAIGVPLAAAVGWVAGSRLETVSAWQPLAYLGGATAVLLACVIGSIVPSRRASRVEPTEALRAD